MSDLRNGVSSVSDDFECKFCGALVYWGPAWNAKGEERRQLFTAASHRPHDCKAKPDADAFDVVPE